MRLDWKFIAEAFPDIASHIPTTIVIVLGALLIAIPFALIFALILNKKVAVLSAIVQVYMSLIYGTPTILQIYLMYNRGPVLIQSFFNSIGADVDVYSWNPIIYACIIVSFSSTVYLTDAFRSAIASLDKGQLEAAHSVGMTSVQAYRRIVLPQAFTVAVPIIGNTVVNAIKSSSLAFALDVLEITGQAQALAFKYFRFIEAYLIIFCIYIILVGLVQLCFKKLEKKAMRYAAV